MFNCCGSNQCNLNEKFNFNIVNTEDGITVNISPKDKSKVKSLQKLAESYKDFCEGDCC